MALVTWPVLHGRLLVTVLEPSKLKGRNRPHKGIENRRSGWGILPRLIGTCIGRYTSCGSMPQVRRLIYRTCQLSCSLRKRVEAKHTYFVTLHGTVSRQACLQCCSSAGNSIVVSHGLR